MTEQNKEMADDGKSPWERDQERARAGAAKNRETEQPAREKSDAERTSTPNASTQAKKK